MRKILFAVTCLIFAACNPALAAPEAFSLSVGAWDYGVDGTLTSEGTRVPLTEQSEPGLDVQLFAQLPFERLWVPAIRARYLEVEAQSNAQFADTQTFLGLQVAAGSAELEVDIDVQFYDLYFIWDWGEELFFSAGVGVKSVDAEADATVVTRVTTGGPVPPPITSIEVRQAQEDFGFTIPALYIGGGYQINKWFTLQAEVDGLGDGDNHFVAGQALVRVTPVKNLGVEVGWRIIDIQGEADESRLDVEADGPFLGVVVEFGGSS